MSLSPPCENPKLTVKDRDHLLTRNYNNMALNILK